MASRKYQMYYDYRKRTSGGFFDVVFLSAIMITGSILIFLSLGGAR